MNSSKWRVPSGIKLYWYTWDDKAAVYNSAWGNTHVVDIVVAETLKLIERKSTTLPNLAMLVAESLKIDSDIQLYPYLKQVVTKLEELGLVERIQI